MLYNVTQYNTLMSNSLFKTAGRNIPPPNTHTQTSSSNHLEKKLQKAYATRKEQMVAIRNGIQNNANLL